MKTILSLSSPPSLLFLSDHFHTHSSSHFSFISCHFLHQPASITRLSSSPSSSSVIQGPDSALPSDSLPFNGCKGCGKEQIESGCNGEGRIQGGIATIPGFGWWPIKAYRPCPAFLASGGSYKRRGQSLDEVAFGRGKGGAAAMYDSDESETRKKGKNRKQFKS